MIAHCTLHIIETLFHRWEHHHCQLYYVGCLMALCNSTTVTDHYYEQLAPRSYT